MASIEVEVAPLGDAVRQHMLETAHRLLRQVREDLTMHRSIAGATIIEAWRLGQLEAAVQIAENAAQTAAFWSAAQQDADAAEFAEVQSRG